MAEGNKSFAVIVTGLSPNATEKSVSDFFSFCGKIVNISLKKGSEVTAIIQFETESASRTALLLSQAIIDNHVIKVQLQENTTFEEGNSSTVNTANNNEKNEDLLSFAFSSSDSGKKNDNKQGKGILISFDDIDDIGDELEITDFPSQNTPLQPDNSNNSNNPNPNPNPQSNAPGNFVDEVINAAKQFDGENKIAEKLNQGAELIKSKAIELNEQYRVVEQANQLGNQITNTLNELDNQYRISDHANLALHNLNQVVSQSINTAMENPNIQNAMQSFTNWGINFTRNVSSLFNPTPPPVSRSTKPPPSNPLNPNPNPPPQPVHSNLPVHNIYSDKYPVNPEPNPNSNPESNSNSNSQPFPAPNPYHFDNLDFSDL